MDIDVRLALDLAIDVAESGRVGAAMEIVRFVRSTFPETTSIVVPSQSEVDKLVGKMQDLASRRHNGTLDDDRVKA